MVHGTCYLGVLLGSSDTRTRVVVVETRLLEKLCRLEAEQVFPPGMSERSVCVVMAGLTCVP